jgi:hypothetical protein
VCCARATCEARERRARGESGASVHLKLINLSVRNLCGRDEYEYQMERANSMESSIGEEEKAV